MRHFAPKVHSSGCSAAALFVSLCVLTANANAQFPAGFQDQTTALPLNAGQVMRLHNGDTAWFDGNNLMLDHNGVPQPVLTFPGAPLFGSFTLQVAPDVLLFGENSNGTLWRVPLNGAPAVLTTLPLNYDAVLYRPGLALISAKTGGFGSPDNDLLGLDLTTGFTVTIARLPGTSGPVEVDAAGNVYYATATANWPPVPGTVDVLRLPQAAIWQRLTGGPILGPQHAQVLFTGLDSASDIALDSDGDLLFVDWFNNVIGELDNVTGGTPTRGNVANYSAQTFGAGALQFVRGTGDGQFEPFQPAGGQLLVHESAWGTVNQLRQVTARRAVLTAPAQQPVPIGAFQLTVTGGPANGAALIAGSAQVSMFELPLAIPGFDTLLWWNLGLQSGAVTFLGNFDGNGNCTFTVQNPGLAIPVPVVAQVAFVDAGLAFIGSSNPISFAIGQ